MENNKILILFCYFVLSSNMTIKAENSLLLSDWQVFDTTIFSASICNGDVFILNGNVFDQAGIYTEVLTAQDGSDSVVILNLEILPVDTTYLSIDMCPGDTSQFTGVIYKNEGAFNEPLGIFQNQFGCDSTVEANLTVHPIEWWEGWGYVPYGYIVNGMPIYEPTTLASQFDTTEYGCPVIMVFTYIPSTPVEELIQEIKLKIYPVPLIDILNIEFVLPEPTEFGLSLFNIGGKKIETLKEDKVLFAGHHHFSFNENSLPPGNYLLQFEIGSEAFVKQIFKE